VAVYEHDDRPEPLLNTGELASRLRSTHEGHPPVIEREQRQRPAGTDVTLGPATQIDIDSGQVSFLVPFNGQWPNEYWLRAFRQAQSAWPPHLVEPRLDEGRGLVMGPLPAQDLEEHVHAAQDRVAAANRIFTEEIEPELRRQREEALRREQEEHRLQADVEAKLKALLG
jgi:hypothetical protein